jgi:hypothetical protein
MVIGDFRSECTRVWYELKLVSYEGQGWLARSRKLQKRATKKAELFNRVIRHTTCLGGYQAFFIPRQRNVPSSSKKVRYLAI